MDTEEVLALDGVSVRLDGRVILDNVGFTLRRGEFTGLIGPNGAGKTTILRVILGLQSIDEGTVTIGAASGRKGRKSVGYVPQKLQIDADVPLRARDLVGLGIDGQRLGIPIPSQARRRKIDAMLDRVDGRRFADARVGSLSGGELQRVLIAHALISDPQLLLLDEPLANLDMRSEQEVVAVLSRLCKEQGIAVLISAHEMNTLLPVMDRVVYVAKGRAMSGTTGEVVRSDVLSSLYGNRVEVIRVGSRVLVVSGDDAEIVHSSCDDPQSSEDGIEELKR